MRGIRGTTYTWLVRKIILTKLRRPGAFFTAQEFFNLVLYAVIGLSLVSFKKPIDVPLSPSPAARELPFSVFYIPGVASGPLCIARSALLYAPQAGGVGAAAAAAAALLSEPGAACTALGFATADALLDAFLSDSSLQQDTVGALFFHGFEGGALGNLGNYTIAMSREMIQVVGEDARRDFKWPADKELPKARRAYAGFNDEDSAWHSSGFVSLQWAVDRAVVSVASGVPVATVSSATAVEVVRFPLQPFKSAYSADSAFILRFLLPLFACIPPFTMSMLLTQFMLNEKCYNLVEGMRMMGMSYSSYYLSWFTVYGCMQAIGASVQTIAFAAIGWFPNSSYFLLWLTLLLTGFATLTFTFLVVSTARGDVNDPEKMKQFTMFLSFLSFIAVVGTFAALAFLNGPTGAWVVLSLLAHVAGLGGVSQFVLAETAGSGLTWSSLFTSDSAIPPLFAMWGFLLLDTFIYASLAVYLSRRAVGAVPAG